MRKTIHKWFWAWDFEKEEKWLNEMSAKGLSLVAVSYCKYTFEDATPGEYTVRLEFLEKVPTHIESTQYVKFLEDTGAEYLGSVMRWVYFRRKKELGDFDIYSDFDSRIKYLNRILVPLGVIGGFNLFNALNMLRLGLLADVQFSITISILPFLLALLCGFGFFKILRKVNKLKKEKNLFE